MKSIRSTGLGAEQPASIIITVYAAAFAPSSDTSICVPLQNCADEQRRIRKCGKICFSLIKSVRNPHCLQRLNHFFIEETVNVELR